MMKSTCVGDTDWTCSADVLVVGGGTAGICAAIAAARSGAKTLLIEQNGFSGGMATAGLVGPFMTCYDKSGQVMIIRGLFKELVERLTERGGAIHPALVRSGTPYTSWIVEGHDHCTPFDAELLKVLLDDMLQEAGVEVLYHTSFLRPVLEGDRLAGVEAMGREGPGTIRASVTIDCTGDGDVAYRAGVPCQKGNGEGTMQPASMFFRINNVDSQALEADIEKNRDNFYRKDGVNYRSLHWRVSGAREAGDWPLDRVSIGIFRCVREDEWAVNASRIMGVDSTGSRSLARGEIVGRRQVQIIMRFLNKYVPGCGNARLMSTGSTLGIRESRHIEGEYTLTLDDVLEGKTPEDAVVLCANSVDIHGRYGPRSSEYITVQKGEYYGIPYRCLIPRKIDGLLAAGRCLSAQSEAAGAVRVMPPCMAMGQAAGTAAALAAQKGIPPRKLDAKELCAKLRRDGVFLA